MTQSRCMSYNYYTPNMRQLSSTDTGPGGPGALLLTTVELSRTGLMMRRTKTVRQQRMCALV